MGEEMVRPAGLEPATCGFEGRRSIQLSYGRTWMKSQSPRLLDLDYRAELFGRQAILSA